MIKGVVFVRGTLTDAHLAAVENEKDSLLTVRAAAGGVGLSQMTIRQWVYRYHLPHGFADGRLVILSSEIHACYQARRHAGGGEPRPTAAERRSQVVTSNRP